MSSFNTHFEILQHEMESHQIPSKAINMANYLKNKFECYGIKSPVRNEIQKKWFASIKSEDFNHWDVVFNLWNVDQREYQYIALDYLRKVPRKKIEIDDHKYLEEIITTKSWWDTVDAIGSNYSGAYFKYKNDVDFELLKSLIIQYQTNPEFFIQKAIGWSLRQYSKFNPEVVRNFVEEINLQGLAKREAIKYV